MTRLFGIIGSPITHSLSPVMHTAALRLDALYGSFDVPPRFLKPILRALILSGVEGLNVTVPLKERVMPLLDRLDSTAQAIGAVNTIVIKHRRTVGYNTDGRGFSQALQELGWRPGAVRAILLGAGGAARAVAYELTRYAGSDLTIANRHLARAQHLVRWISREHPRACVRVASLDRLAVDRADVLVNATTVGMSSRDGLLIDPSALRRGMVVYDLVYHRETALVRAARRRGCVAAGGLSMLLYQGAESFRLWLGRPAPIEVMRDALARAVAARASHIER